MLSGKPASATPCSLRPWNLPLMTSVTLPLSGSLPVLHQVLSTSNRPLAAPGCWHCPLLVNQSPTSRSQFFTMNSVQCTKPHTEHCNEHCGPLQCLVWDSHCEVAAQTLEMQFYNLSQLSSTAHSCFYKMISTFVFCTIETYCSRLFNSLHSNVVCWEVGESWRVSGVLNPPAKPIASPLNTIALDINTHDGIHCKL